MSRTRDYLCMFRSKFDVMLKLSDVGLREITQAMFDFLEGEEPVFSDLQAQALWWSWSLEFSAQEKKAEEISERKKRSGKLGGRPKKDETENQMLSEKPNAFFENQKNQMLSEKPNAFLKSYTDTDTDTDTDKENIIIENNNIKENYPTKEKILQLAKDPSVALPPEEAEKFFDHYTAQSWTRSNGQAIPNTSPALISMLRMWKSNSVNFAPRQQTFSYGNQQPQKSRRERIDDTIRNNRDCFIELFNCTESHYYGDYDNDPRTWDDWSYRENVLNKIENEGFSTQFKIYAKYRKEN